MKLKEGGRGQPRSLVCTQQSNQEQWFQKSLLDHNPVEVIKQKQSQGTRAPSFANCKKESQRDFQIPSSISQLPTTVVSQS